MNYKITVWEKTCIMDAENAMKFYKKVEPSLNCGLTSWVQEKTEEEPNAWF